MAATRRRIGEGRRMSTARTAEQAAVDEGSGQAGTGHAGGTGPARASAGAAKGEDQRDDAGTGRSRPGDGATA